MAVGPPASVLLTQPSRLGDGLGARGRLADSSFWREVSERLEAWEGMEGGLPGRGLDLGGDSAGPPESHEASKGRGVLIACFEGVCGVFE